MSITFSRYILTLVTATFTHGVECYVLGRLLMIRNLPTPGTLPVTFLLEKLQ